MFMRQLTLATAVLVAGLGVDVAAEKSAVINNGQTDRMKIWSLLVAGSNEYKNYRHQADICHAYHLLSNHGVPDERIVVMMYDDIAYNRYNPTPGVIINHPNGNSVYRGVPKDYTGKLVTLQNFLDILQGKKVKGGSGKVIASGPNDHVFVNFVGHGGSGLLVFPDGYLPARQFVSVINQMHLNKKFAKMVIYIEACESGSMFDKLLPANVDVYATTAANPGEPSYACYKDNYRKAYLGDVYSVKWMEDSDRKDLRKETLIDQFRLVKKQTTTSHVMQYGDLSVGRLSLSKFQGEKYAHPIVVPAVPCYPVSNRDLPIAIMRQNLRTASSPSVLLSRWSELQLALRKRSFLDNKIAELASKISENNEESTMALLRNKKTLTNFDCYERALRHFSVNCFNLSRNPYVLGHLSVLVNMCERDFGIKKITDAIDLVCTNITVVGVV